MRGKSCRSLLLLSAVGFMFGAVGILSSEEGPSKSAAVQKQDFRLAMFSTEVTCPVGHPLLAGLIQPAKKIVDPLYARGLVLLGAGQPLVLCTVDWCEIRNQSYDRWRAALAKAAGTSKERVLLCCLHQHDTPVTDLGAEELLAKVKLGGKMFDPAFEEKCIARTAESLTKSLKQSRKITHLGTGQAKVEKVASNRRVELADGKITYGRGSSSGGNKTFADAPDGVIDPWLKTLSFWDGGQAVAALHCYATHPMSYYGQGGVSGDFVGMARELMQKDNPDVFQLYASGCSGDVTAGKYNDGAPANRPILAQRLVQAMKQAQKATKKVPLEKVDVRHTALALDFRAGPKHTRDALTRVVENGKETDRNRILAAMGLSSMNRVASGHTIDFPCLDFGAAQVILFPGEAFVGYQLLAQQQRPDGFVLSIGYGECWPGYIPSTQAFNDNFDDVWYWVGTKADQQIETALQKILPK